MCPQRLCAAALTGEFVPSVAVQKSMAPADFKVSRPQQPSYSIRRYETEPHSVQERLLFATSLAQREAREMRLQRDLVAMCAALGDYTPIQPRANDGMVRDLEVLENQARRR